MHHVRITFDSVDILEGWKTRDKRPLPLTQRARVALTLGHPFLPRSQSQINYFSFSFFKMFFSLPRVMYV